MLVSVLINNYNYGEYLAYCLESVLNQTYKNIEIIVYDDGSVDCSREILKQYEDKITVLYRDSFKDIPAFNQANAIYQAFKVSKGEIVCLLDSDDAFYPNKVEKIVKKFKANEKAVMVQHPFHKIDRKSNIINQKEKYPKLSYNRNHRKRIYLTNQLFGLFTLTSGISCRRWYLNEVLKSNLIDEYKLLWSDYRIRTQAIFYGKIVSIRKPLGKYRIHGNNDSRRFEDFLYNFIYRKQAYKFFNEIAVKKGEKKLIFEKNIDVNNIKYLILKAMHAVGLEKLFKTIYFNSNTYRQNHLIQNFQLYYALLNKWLEEKNKGITIVDFFYDNSIKKIGIYGCGELGKRLFEELKGTEIKVSYFVDINFKNLRYIPKNAPVFVLNELNQAEHVDALIITPFLYYDSIVSDNRIKALNVPLVSLEKIVYRNSI